ncbi:MAG: GAF domain-containing protein [Brevinematia bacterium]
MKSAKKAIAIFFDIFILLFISGWIYMLYREFISLPRDNELLKFFIFQIKLILFTLFLISSIAFIWFTGFRKNGKESIDLNFLKKEFEGLNKLIQTKLEDKSYVDVIDKKLFLSSEIEKLIDAKNIEEIFKLLFKSVEKITKAERISLQFFDFSEKKLKLIKKKGFELVDNYIAFENPPSYLAFNSNKRLFVTNIETHPGLKLENRPYYSKKSFMIFPIRMFGKTFGVFNVSEKDSPDGTFSVEDFEKASLLVTAFAQKIENIILYISLEDLISQ